MQTCREQELIPVLLNHTGQGQSSPPLYALIDGTGSSNALYNFFRHAPEADYHPLFLGTNLADCLPHSPYLVQLTPQHTTFLELGRQPLQGMVWFTSPYTLEQQIAFWKNRLFVQLPDYETALFRYWSGPVLNRYLATLSLSQQQQFLLPVSVIATPSAESRQWHLWNIHDALDTNPVIGLRDPETWTLSQDQLQAFNQQFEDILINEIEAELWVAMPAYLERIHPAFIAQRIRAGIRQARQLTLQSDEALYQFVECQLRWGDDFWNRPAFQSLWQAQNGESIFIERWDELG